MVEHPIPTIYSATKAGLQMFTPGMIATPLAQAVWAKTGFDADAASAGFPLRRPGRPEEVANAVLFRLGPAASYITGETLTVGGGPALKGMISVD